MKKEIFVSNGLADIRKNLSKQPIRNNTAAEESVKEYGKNREQNYINNSIKNSEKELSKALEMRFQEFSRLKRDVIAQITSYLSSIPGKIEIYEDNIQKLGTAHAKLKTIIEDLKTIDEHDFSDTTVTELGKAIKQVENARLEFLRISANLEPVYQNGATGTSNVSSSLLPEILSLSFRQLMRLGLALFLPLIITIFIAAFILGLIIIFAIGG